MQMPLPLHSFAWMSAEEIASFDPINDVTMKPGPGYILEVTLRYPKELHVLHNSFPLAAEHIEITENDLSPYALECLNGLNMKSKYTAKKLSATFRDRVRYVCHGLNLKLYLELGLELVSVHRGVKFVQDNYFKDYVSMCSNKRAQAMTKSEGNMYKLLSNSLYGKLIEGTKNRMVCQFNMHEKKALRNFSDPLYKGVVICDEDFSVSFHHKREVYNRQSWAVGFTVLELSKYVMSDLYYNYVQPRFDYNCSVCLSDTDSWVLAAPCQSSDQVVSRLSDIMDFSNYEVTHPLYNSSRKNVVGFLKNEVPKDEIIKFVGLKSKTYAFMTKKQDLEAKAKGVKTCYKRKLSFDTYKACLDDICSKTITQVSIVSKNHQNMLVKSDRVAFSSFDDKRYLLCRYHTCPYGSHLIDLHKDTGKCFFCENSNVLA